MIRIFVFTIMPLFLLPSCSPIVNDPCAINDIGEPSDSELECLLSEEGGGTEYKVVTADHLLPEFGSVHEKLDRGAGIGEWNIQASVIEKPSFSQTWWITVEEIRVPPPGAFRVTYDDSLDILMRSEYQYADGREVEREDFVSRYRIKLREYHKDVWTDGAKLYGSDPPFWELKREVSKETAMSVKQLFREAISGTRHPVVPVSRFTDGTSMVFNVKTENGMSLYGRGEVRSQLDFDKLPGKLYQFSRHKLRPFVEDPDNVNEVELVLAARELANKFSKAK